MKRCQEASLPGNGDEFWTQQDWTPPSYDWYLIFD